MKHMHLLLDKLPSPSLRHVGVGVMFSVLFMPLIAFAVTTPATQAVETAPQPSTNAPTTGGGDIKPETAKPEDKKKETEEEKKLKERCIAAEKAKISGEDMKRPLTDEEEKACKKLNEVPLKGIEKVEEKAEGGEDPSEGAIGTPARKSASHNASDNIGKEIRLGGLADGEGAEGTNNANLPKQGFVPVPKNKPNDSGKTKEETQSKLSVAGNNKIEAEKVSLNTTDTVRGTEAKFKPEPATPSELSQAQSTLSKPATSILKNNRWPNSLKGRRALTLQYCRERGASEQVCANVVGTIEIESTFDPSARNGEGSSAFGLGQYTKGTWASECRMFLGKSKEDCAFARTNPKAQLDVLISSVQTRYNKYKRGDLACSGLDFTTCNYAIYHHSGGWKVKAYVDRGLSYFRSKSSQAYNAYKSAFNQLADLNPEVAMAQLSLTNIRSAFIPSGTNSNSTNKRNYKYSGSLGPNYSTPTFGGRGQLSSSGGSARATAATMPTGVAPGVAPGAAKPPVVTVAGQVPAAAVKPTVGVPDAKPTQAVVQSAVDVKNMIPNTPLPAVPVKPACDNSGSAYDMLMRAQSGECVVSVGGGV